VSAVTPTLVSGWVGSDGLSTTTIQVGVPPTDLAPPGNYKNAGLVPTIARYATKTYRSVAFARGDAAFLSGQISVAHYANLSASVQILSANSETSAGTIVWSKAVTVRTGEVIIWNDLPISSPFYYVQITYSESAAATGYRIFLDNLSMLFTDKKLGVDYPGYFDGRTAGGAWIGNADSSVSQYYGGGRRAYAEVVQSIDISSMASGTRAEFVVDMVIPSTFWEDLIESEATIDIDNPNLLAGTEYDIENLTQTTAMIDDSVITITKTGTVSNITLTDVASGASLTIAGTLPTAAIVIDNKTFTVKSNGASLISSVTRKRSNQLLPLTPMSSTLPPRISVRGSGSGTISLQINARRRYMVA
jgi:hypothetical protein